MNSEIKRFKPNNERLYQMIRSTCHGMVEESPQAQEMYALHAKFMESMKGKIDQDTSTEMDDLIFAVANFFSEAMFDLGITIGNNPSVILDLPDTTGPFSF